MKLTAEISLYPLNQDYIPIIKEFVIALRKYTDLTLVTNAMSTQVCGGYEAVFAALENELRASYERHGKQVLVAKFIVGELDIGERPNF